MPLITKTLRLPKYLIESAETISFYADCSTSKVMRDAIEIGMRELHKNYMQNKGDLHALAKTHIKYASQSLLKRKLRNVCDEDMAILLILLAGLNAK